METKKNKARQTTVIIAAVVAIAATVIAVLAIRERDAAEAPAGEAAAERKASNGKPIKDVAVSARAKQAEASTAKAARTKSGHPVAGEDAAEKAKADGVDAKKNVVGDNPFPRYLDMFKNNPEALAAEFLKEAEADRAKQREIRDKTIEKLKLNGEQTVIFEKALDGLRDEITRQNEEWVELITSGQLNEDTAAEGSIWSSNPLLGQRMVAARETAVRETAEKLYEQLVINGVSDAEEQYALLRVVQSTAFSYECLEPNLAVYDKMYKNMGVGKGIFSWCRRQRQMKNK